MIDLVGHFVVFLVGGVAIGLVPLIIGRFLRPKSPGVVKEDTYECGEQTIGSSYVQFDLRFYTVALLFIIFDVEVAFFFPWAMVYGGAVQLADNGLGDAARIELSEKLLNQAPGTLAAADAVSSDMAARLAQAGLVDVVVFFGVLLVGFAYVWKRGDLDWVRALASRPRMGEESIDSLTTAGSTDRLGPPIM